MRSNDGGDVHLFYTMTTTGPGHDSQRNMRWYTKQVTIFHDGYELRRRLVILLPISSLEDSDSDLTPSIHREAELSPLRIRAQIGRIRTTLAINHSQSVEKQG
jgi:hypothetical protein